MFLKGWNKIGIVSDIYAMLEINIIRVFLTQSVFVAPSASEEINKIY